MTEDPSLYNSTRSDLFGFYHIAQLQLLVHQYGIPTSVSTPYLHLNFLIMTLLNPKFETPEEQEKFRLVAASDEELSTLISQLRARLGDLATIQRELKLDNYRLLEINNEILDVRLEGARFSKGLGRRRAMMNGTLAEREAWSQMECDVGVVMFKVRLKHLKECMQKELVVRNDEGWF